MAAAGLCGVCGGTCRSGSWLDVSMARHTLARGSQHGPTTETAFTRPKSPLGGVHQCLPPRGHGRELEVLLGIGDLDLTLHLLDSGPGVPATGHHRADWPEETAEHGRGMALMNAFTDSGSFASQYGGGTVRLEKRLLRHAAVA